MQLGHCLTKIIENLPYTFFIPDLTTPESEIIEDIIILF